MKHDIVGIVSCETLANGYLHLTLEMSATEALPGQYVAIESHHLAYIMGQNKGLELILPPSFPPLEQQQTLSISPFQGSPLPRPDKQQFCLLIVEPQGLGACLFYLKKYRAHFKGLAIIGAEADFPFFPCPSRQLIPGVPADVIAALPLLEDWGIPHRLASLKEIPGVFEGTAQDFANLWLAQSFIPNLKEIIIPSHS